MSQWVCRAQLQAAMVQWGGLLISWSHPNCAHNGPRSQALLTGASPRRWRP